MNGIERVTLAGSVIRGTLGFAAVSLVAFSVWAYGASWIRGRFGEVGLYAGIAIVFLAASGLVLHRLAGGMARFYKAFIPSFLAYAIVWSAIWFAMQSRLGEWLATLAGTAVFALVASLILGRPRAWPKAAAVLFGTHVVGYFLGGVVYYECKEPAAMEALGESYRVVGRLGWGLLYGLGFGAGLGYTFFALRRETE